MENVPFFVSDTLYFIEKKMFSIDDKVKVKMRNVMAQHWLEEMYEKYKQELFRFLFVILRDTQAAEDALQDTFFKAYLHRSSVGNMQYEKAWIYKIARNTAYDMLRKKKREFPIEKEQLESTLEKNGKSVDMDSSLMYLEMIAELNKTEQEIVSLKIIGGLNYKDIGQVLHMTTASVKKRYERALHKLKEKYKEAGENE